MEQRITIHVLDGESRSRAETARIAFALGHHAEVYSDVEELLARPPGHGILLAQDDPDQGGAGALLARLLDAGFWLPMIAAAARPETGRVVQAIKGGALDYLTLPLDAERLALALDRVSREAARHAEARRRMIEARARIGQLSGREREVLDWLADGSSNKAIARALSISPRTVEIHRANMMGKLGARHPAEAVRLRLEARL